MQQELLEGGKVRGHLSLHDDYVNVHCMFLLYAMLIVCNEPVVCFVCVDAYHYDMLLLLLMLGCLASLFIA